MSSESFEPTSEAIRRVTSLARGAATSDGMGVRLTRIVGQPALPEVDPFLLLDEFRSDNPTDYLGGFPDHPHRGFDTVTYMLAGRMRHWDNKGHSGLLKPGGAQWMTAGSGLIHSEMPEQENGLLWGFQLWVNLPRANKMTPPRYQDIEPEAIPELTPAAGVKVRLIAGRFGAAVGPVQAVATEPLYLDVMLAPFAEFVIPVDPAHNCMAYVFEGAASTGPAHVPQTVRQGEISLYGEGQAVRVATDGQRARLLVLSARPLNEPIVRHGPFVMSTADEIRQAIQDYRSGRM